MGQIVAVAWVSDARTSQGEEFAQVEVSAETARVVNNAVVATRQAAGSLLVALA